MVINKKPKKNTPINDTPKADEPEPAKKKLTLKQTLFCKYFIEGYKKEFPKGNGLRSLAKAYDKDPVKDAGSCKTMAYENLTKPYIREYLNELLRVQGWDDITMDSRLLEIALEGRDADSMRAIQEYNKLKQRITDKSESTQDINVTIKKI